MNVIIQSGELTALIFQHFTVSRDNINESIAKNNIVPFSNYNC